MSDSSAPCDISIHLGHPPSWNNSSSHSASKLKYTSPYTNENNDPSLKIWDIRDGEFLRLDYSDGTQFWLDRACQNLWSVWPSNQSLENTISYLLGPVFGLILRLRGITCLHASAVAVDDQVAAFVGPAGAGKSTTAAAFARRGFAVLSDDIVAVIEMGQRFCVLPAYPHLSLWPESVEMLFGSADALPRFTLDWEKRCLALGTTDTRFESRTLPLAAIFVLAQRTVAPVSSIVPLPPQAALLSLLPNTYATNVLDANLRAKEFEFLGRLVTRVPVRQLLPDSDPAKLPNMCDAVLSDLASVPD